MPNQSLLRGDRVLLYSVVIACIGLICASIVTWPAMVCIALCLSGAIPFLALARGRDVAEAGLEAIGTLVLIQSSYVACGFIFSLVRRWRLVDTKRST